MKSRSILTVAALFAAALFILDVPAAMATDFTWDGSASTAWNNPANWTAGSGYPDDSGDTATIPSSSVKNEPTVNVNVTVGSVTVQANRTLTLTADLTTGSLTMECDGIVTTGANTLTITNSGGLTINTGGLLNVNGAGEVRLTGGGTHTINGTAADIGLRLSVDGSTLRIYDANVTLTGTGYVEGRNNGAQILITDGETLTNEITIEGSLQICGPGTLDNEGLVEATRANNENDNKLECYSGTFSGGTTGDYKVNTASAYLTFRAGGDFDGMSADFIVGAGTLDVNESVCTTGDLTFTGGTIDVIASESFKCGGTCP